MLLILRCSIGNRKMSGRRLQSGILLCGEVDVDAAMGPSPDVVVELLKTCAFGMTADDESAEFVECREGEVTRLLANGCPAIGTKPDGSVTSPTDG